MPDEIPLALRLWPLYLALACLIMGAGFGILIYRNIVVRPIQERSQASIESLETRVKTLSTMRVKEFINEIESAPDTSVITDYLSDELRERLKDLLN